MMVTETQASIIDQVLSERARQVNKWGKQLQNTPCQWATILTEEVGEVARNAIELEHDAYPLSIDERASRHEWLRTELVQVVAVGMAWLEALDE